MRIRQVKPAFWSDARLAEMSEAVRLFYIGLWMEADDAGWFRWDPVEVSRDLYGYEGRARRERRVAQMFQVLVDAGRVLLHPCGHAEVPKMKDHQHLSVATRQVRTALVEHVERCSPPPPAETRGDPRDAAGARAGIGNGKERVRNGSAPAGADILSLRDEEDRREMAKLAALGKLPNRRGAA